MGTLRLQTPVPMWFVQAPLEDNEVRRQMAAVREQDYAGVLPIIITPKIKHDQWVRDGLFTPEPYLSEAFFARFDTIVEACRENQLQLWIWDDLYCPAGWAGGLMLRQRPDLAPLVVRRIRAGDATQGLEARSILCECGDTRYEVVADGHRVDQYHPDAGRVFTAITHEAYYRRYAADFGRTIVAFFHDEPGNPGGVRTSYRTQEGYLDWPPLAWSTALPAVFQDKYGYDLVPRLPELWIDTPATPAALQVRADYARLVNELWIRNWLAPIRNWCAAHDVLFIGHQNNDANVEEHAKTAGNILASLKAYDVPGIDLVTGQVYPNLENLPPNPWAPYNTLTYNSHLPRFASSAARHKGGVLSLAEVGGVYGAGWSVRHRKWLSDYVFARGIQVHNVGALEYSAAGNALFMYCDGCNPPQPYAPHLPELNRYLAETGALLSLGRAGTRHAVWYSPSSYETRQVKHASEYFDALIECLEFHGIEPDVLGPDDARAAALYDFIYLPARTAPDELERRFLADACGHAQVFAPRDLGLAGAQDFATAAWDAEKQLLENALAVYGGLGSMLTPDFVYEHPTPLRVHWRQLGDSNGLAFIFNDSTLHDFHGPLRLAPAGDDAALYVQTAASDRFQRHAGDVFTLAAEASCVVLWVADPRTLPEELRDRLADDAPPPALPLPAIAWRLTGAVRTVWDGEFSTRPVAPDEAAGLTAAESFSGAITYDGAFDWPTPDHDALLELADLKQAAEVEVNGTRVGAILWKPWTLVIPRQHLQAGPNTIRLTVCNTLADYCRGDEFRIAYRARGLEPDDYWRIGEGLDARVKGIGFRQADKTR